MSERFDEIKVLVWDFDGTLYKPQKPLFHAVREAEYRVIMNHTGWDHDKTEKEFHKLYKIISPSGTTVTAKLAGINHVQAAVETENYFDRTHFLKLDQRLIELFQKLDNFKHIILGNGIKVKLEKALETLGLSPSSFESIVTPEITGVTKPNLAPFEKVLEFTKKSPSEHLMIGDRVQVDLEPAKQLGMKTCLVWSDTPSDGADVTVSTVYDVVNVLL